MGYEYTVPRGPVAAMYTSPGPCYGLPTLIGQVKRVHDPRSEHIKYPAWTFGHGAIVNNNTWGPGPAYLPNRKMHRDGLEGTPHYSLTARRPELTPFNTPGPGSYRPEKNFVISTLPTAPKYRMGDRTRMPAFDKTPAPNSYSLPNVVGHTVQSTVHQKPVYSMRTKTKMGNYADDLAQAPGPGRYNATDPSTYKNRLPRISISSRSFPPGDTTTKPGPGAHMPEKAMYFTYNQPPSFHMGIRHSPYAAPVIMEPPW